MLNNRDLSFVAEDTIKDGNCAVNAFALAIANPLLLRQLDQYLVFKKLNPDQLFAYFITQVAGVLDVEPHWPSVSAALVRVRKSNKIRLQETLAPLLRNIAVTEMRKDADCISRTIQPLSSAFRDSLCQRADIYFKGSPDDVYSKLSLIKEQVDLYVDSFVSQLRKTGFDVHLYNQLRQRENLPEEERMMLNSLESALDAIFKIYQEQLLQWWQVNVPGEKTGYEQFLDVLRKKGEWLGDLELSYLAAYFHVDLDAYREPFFHQVYINKLKMPRHLLTHTRIQQLLARGIIENPDNEERDICFLPFTSIRELSTRLAALENHDALMTFFNEQPVLKKLPLPDQFMPQLEQLRLRNIVELSGQKYVFVVDQADAIDRIIEVSGASEILSWWQTHYFPAAKMTLKNAVGVHWENMLIQHEPSDAPRPALMVNRQHPKSKLNNLSLFFPAKSGKIIDAEVDGLPVLRLPVQQPPALVAAFLVWFVIMLAAARRQFELQNTAPVQPPNLIGWRRMPQDDFGLVTGLFQRNQWHAHRVPQSQPLSAQRPAGHARLNQLPCTII